MDRRNGQNGVDAEKTNMNTKTPGSKAELAQKMVRDAKAFYKRYTAGERPSREELNLITAFGVSVYNSALAYERTQEIRELKAALNEASLTISVRTKQMDEDGYTINRLRAELRQANARLAAATEWTPILSEADLPTEPRRYLFTTQHKIRNGEPKVALMNLRQVWNHQTITAWREIPEPYKEPTK